MFPLDQCFGGFVAINHSHPPAIEPASQQKELLNEVYPVMDVNQYSPSPPTNRIFDFPSIDEYLSNHVEHTKMPLLSSDEEDCFHDTKLLGEADLSGTLTPSSTHTDGSRLPVRRSSQRNEIDEALLRDDYDAENNLQVVAYSLDAVIQSARLHYGSQRPDFCVGKPDRNVKEVKLSGTDVTTEIHYRQWSSSLGFWVLTDNANDSYIVKCMAGKYHVWEGVKEGFARKPAAVVLKVRYKKPPRNFHNSCSNVETSSALTSSLRERTTRQNMPYTMYKTQKKFDDKGLRLSEAQLVEVVNRDDAVFNLKSEHKPKKSKQDNIRTSDSGFGEQDSTNFGARASSALTSVSDEYILGNTILRTRLHDFHKATIPIVAQHCNSHQSFFDAVNQKWAFKLAGSCLLYGVASFPWLGAEKNVLLQESDSDGLNSVMNEVRLAPAWQCEGRVEVTIEFYTN